MPKKWLISDPHFFHENMLEGQKIGIRPFKTLKEMHTAIIEGWNSVVGESDKVYVLGDLTMKRPGNITLEHHYWMMDLFLNRLKGHKRLILGNHDHLELDRYFKFGFEQVLAMKKLEDVLLTHIPVHDGQFVRFKGNIHGHTHEFSLQDKRYLNVCVEPLKYVPIEFEEARARIKD